MQSTNVVQMWISGGGPNFPWSEDADSNVPRRLWVKVFLRGVESGAMEPPLNETSRNLGAGYAPTG
jgi:hypothetical protein